MTAIHPDLSPASITPTSQSVARRRLQDLVRADAIVCAVSGFALLAAADALADLAGVATTGPVRAVGAFLVVLGMGLAWLGSAGDDARQRWIPLSAAGDIAWALASFALAFVADLSGPGRALILVQGVLVLAIGEAKLVLRRRAGER